MKEYWTQADTVQDDTRLQYSAGWHKMTVRTTQDDRYNCLTKYKTGSTKMKYLLEFLLKNYNVDRNQRPVSQEDGLEQPVN